MDAVTYTELRKNLKSYLDDVYHGHMPIIVARKEKKNVVFLSMEDYNSLVETHYLLSSENNAKHLRKSLKQARQGKLLKKKLIEV